MRLSKSIDLSSFRDDGMARRYLEINGIAGAFVWKEDEKHWQVLEGKPEEKTGFLSAEFTTRKEAKLYCDSLNARIAALH